MKVSIIMSVCNAGPFLRPAVDSLLRQTLTDWEMLVVDDCSEDASVSILLSYADSRIRLMRNSRRMGPAVSRNRALQQAQGEYIAIMDADDIAYPQRFEKQVTFLATHPDIDILGSYADAIDEKGEKLYDIKPPTSAAELRTRLLFESAMVHSSAMFRASAMRLFRLHYDEYYLYAQDFELFSRASRFVNLANYPEKLVAYRVSPNAISSRQRNLQSRYALEVIFKQFNFLSIHANNLQKELIDVTLYHYRPMSRTERIAFLQLFISVYYFCIHEKMYDMPQLRRYFARLYALASSGKGGILRWPFITLDLLQVIQQPGKDVRFSQFCSFTCFYFKSLISHILFHNY